MWARVSHDDVMPVFLDFNFDSKFGCSKNYIWISLFVSKEG